MTEKEQNHHVLKTSELLENIAANHSRENISLGEIKNSLHERGFGVLFIVFCLPLLIPLPLPTGLGTAMSMPIFFFSYQLIVGADSPWLPAWVLRKEFGIETFRKIIRKSSRSLRFIEKFLKERLPAVSESRGYEIFTGVFILLLNIPICLPFPMSNTIPAVSIIVIAFGMLEKDGLMILFGKFIGIIAWLICILIGIAIYYGANEALKFLPAGLRDDFKNLKHKIEPEINEYKQEYMDNDSDYQDYHSLKKYEPASEAKPAAKAK